MVWLFSDDFYEDSFFSFAVEFAVEDLLPGAEVKFGICYGDDNFTSHYRSFEMSVSVIFGAIVVILRVWFFGGEFFEPGFEILMKARFVIVDEDRGGDVHRIDEAETFFDT